MTGREVLAAVNELDWYRRCLEDVQDRRPVRGLDEAKVGYDAAMQRLVDFFALTDLDAELNQGAQPER